MCCKGVSGTEANTRVLANTLRVVCRGSAEMKHFKETNVKPRNPQFQLCLRRGEWLYFISGGDESVAWTLTNGS